MTNNENKIRYEVPLYAIRNPDSFPHGQARAMHWRGFGNGFLVAAALALLFTILIATKVLTFPGSADSGTDLKGKVPPPNTSYGGRTAAPVEDAEEEVTGRGRAPAPTGERPLSK